MSMDEYAAELFYVTGKVESDRSFSISELIKMDIIQTDERAHACGSGDPKGRIEPCRGILLSDIINATEVDIADHNDTKKMYVVVSADDGYRTLFSWQELFNTEGGEGVMIILERGDTNLFEQHGRVDLFSSRDFLTGPRYVKNVKKIEVVLLGECTSD